MIKILQHTRRPDIVFLRNGTIRISACASRLLSLCPGDSINIAVRDGEYLLHAIHNFGKLGSHRAKCYRTKRGGDTFYANSVRLAKTMLDAANVSADCVAFFLGEPVVVDDVVYIPIITRYPL